MNDSRRAAVISAIAACASLTTAASAGVNQAPIPLTAPTGYRDYCDGMTLHHQQRICGRGRVPLAFWRPLKLPTIAQGQQCPVSHRRAITKHVRGVGRGPIYFTHVIPWLVLFPAPENSVAAGTGWAIDKTPFVWKRSFRGPFLIRGARIEGQGELGFSGPSGRRPFAAMQFARGRSGLEFSRLRGWGVGVWMTTPGCYAFQIDTRSSSRVIVFRVEPLRS
jgi:hypothetical protein